MCMTFSLADTRPELEFENEEEVEPEENEDRAEVFTCGRGVPIRACASITKPSSGAGMIFSETIVAEGSFAVGNISFYENAQLHVPPDFSVKPDWVRRRPYIGPQYQIIDIGINDAFDAFIAERGVDEDLALFIPKYAQRRRQQEYVRWLGKVKNFIDLQAS